MITIGVIISTYNNPDWLRKTLWGYAAQTRKADEIVIADDGSGDETRLLIGSLKPILPIKHVWHEDNGFRKTAILNAAISQATSDYLIFTDQDCVPRNDFVATHATLARQGRFLSGGYFKLPMSLSRQITRNDIASGNAFRLSWLKAQGLPYTFKQIKLIKNKAFSRLMNAVTPTYATWNGMNSSGWRTDILAVNGFDERMRYGGLDREMGERMMNNGVRPTQVRYSAIILHLDHSRPYKNAEALRRNLEIRETVKRQHLTWTEFGIKNKLNE